MNVIKVTPRGYCHGVVTALNIAVEAANNNELPKPIHILGEIVHNQNITKALEQLNIITITGKNREEILDKVDSGTVIITAHGISPNLIQIAKNKKLHIIDATCIDVYKTHNIIKKRLEKNYQILYIGKKDHPEPEGAIGIDPKNIFLITSKNDIDNLNISPSQKNLAITNQTTMSLWETRDLLKYAKNKYPRLEIIEEICPATSQRQTAVFNQVKDVDLTIVVGDPKSNNTNKLVEVSKKLSKTNAYRVSTLEDIDISWFLEKNINNVAVTSGASTPTQITKEVITFLEQFNEKNKDTWNTNSKINLSNILPRNRKKQ